MIDLRMLMSRIKNHNVSKSNEESELIQLIKEHPENFGEIYKIYVQRVFRYIFNRVGNHNDAEDITSQVFISAFESFHRYVDNGYFAAWLFTIARRKVIDYYRCNHPHSALDENVFTIYDESMDAKIIHHQRQKALKDMLDDLSTQEKELIRLRFIAELKFADMAKILGRSESATKKAFYRLISRLQEKMEASND